MAAIISLFFMMPAIFAAAVCVRNAFFSDVV